MADFKPNKYQEAIYDFILNGEGNAVVNAVAGAGKTSTLINVLNIIPDDKQILFLAFNKSIVDELKVKIGSKPNVQVKTLHSLGSSVCYNAFHSTINADKYVKYINKCIKDKKFKPTKSLTKDEMSSGARNIRQRCDLGRIELCTDQFSLRNVVKKHDILIEDNEIECAVKAIKWGESDVSEIDFSDMIYFPNVKKVDIPTFDFVFIDECQDLNAAQRELFLKCVDPDDGRFMGVGDKSQAIYGFAGSDVESFNKLVNLKNTVELPLSVCYRCDKSIVEKAKALVPQIEYKEGADEGVIDPNAKITDVKDGDMIVCRVSAPLIGLCMKFIKEGTKAYVKGRDTGANLIGMIRKTGKEKVSEMINTIYEEQHELIKKICSLNGYDESEAQETSMFQNFKDKFDAIKYLCDGYEKTDDVIKRIEDIFSDNNGKGICLSTVHKAKGLENDRVFILNEDKFYPKWAMRNKIQSVQEKNLEYVAITRPKKYLGYIKFDSSI